MRADLDAMPDDGRRYEIIDGVLVVSAAPGRLHQRATRRLLALLDAACPAEFEVLSAPFTVALADDTQTDGEYRLVAKVTGEEKFRAKLPNPVTVVPAGLVR